METEVSLTHSQELSTGSYSEPDQASQHLPPTNPISPRSISILSTHLHLGLPSVFVRYQKKNCIDFNKAYDSVRREILYSNFIEFDV
jgi:hypothetical protein